MSLSNALDFLKTPDSEAEKYPASDKPETGFAARRCGLVPLTGVELPESVFAFFCKLLKTAL